MKILPANQTLILAAEREPSVVPRAAAGPVLGASLVAAKPDAPVLFLRADHSPPEDAVADRTIVPSPVRQAPVGRALAPRSSGGRSGPQSFRQAALYAETQRLPLAEALMPYVDVYA